MMAVFVYAALPLAHPRLVWQRLVHAAWVRRIGLLVGGGVLAFLFYASVYIPFGQSQYWLLRARFGGPLPALARAVAAAPDNYLPYVALGDYWRKQGDLEAALAAYTQAVERAPQHTPTHAWRLALLRQMANTGEVDHAREDAIAQAMQAIAAVGWDNNQLYKWAWERMPTSAGAVWDAASPAPGVIQGFSAPERDSQHTYRWTQQHAQIRMDYPPQAKRLVLVLYADKPNTPVEVSWGGEVVTTVQAHPGWQRVAIPLKASRNGQGGNTLLELRTSVHVVSPALPYPRGVALAEVRVE
jgi:tetratricopeptide (TPR) repeat protein